MMALQIQRRLIIEDTGLPRTTVTDALGVLTKQGFIQRLGRGAGIGYQLIFWCLRALSASTDIVVDWLIS